MKGITAPNPRAMKKPAVEEKDELGMFPKERHVLVPKAKTAVEKEEHRDAVLAARSSTSSAILGKASAPRPTTPPITAPIFKPTRLEECLPLQRMKDDALDQLKERRQNAQTALDGLVPLVEKSEHIETAVAVLEQQVEIYDQDIANWRYLDAALRLERSRARTSR
jgi:hypothetical protein